MATSPGGATKPSRQKKPKKPKLPTATPQKTLTDIIPHLIATTSATHSFLLRHDLHLLPSQSLTLESLISSTYQSLRNLISLKSVSNLPPTPPLPSPIPFTSFPDQDPRWVEFFNLSKPSFTLLLRLLTPALSSSISPALPPNAALALTLFRLSHAASFTSISRRFNTDPNSACRAFYSVCKAVVENLGHLFEFSSDMNRVTVGFGWMISLPNCCGVLGIRKFELESRKNSSLLVQALVDSEGRFLDVSAGWPGVMKPVEVLRKSKFFSGVEKEKKYLNGEGFELNDGCSVPQYVLGEACYPVFPWILTPYRENKNDELSSSEVAFNEACYKGMDLVETAFARVTDRWKLMGMKWKEENVDAFPYVFVTCCLLHNFLIKCSESMPEVNVESGRDKEFPEFEGEDDESGKIIRDALASHLSPVSQRS